MRLKNEPFLQIAPLFFLLKSPSLSYCSRKPNISGCCSFTFSWLLFWDVDRNVACSSVTSRGIQVLLGWSHFPRLEVVLPTFGAFMFIRSKCGSNMDAKMLLCILSLGAFKWRKQMMQVMKYIKQIWTLPSTQRLLSSAMLQLHITSTQQLPYQNFLQLSELFLWLEGTFTSNFPSWKRVFRIIPTPHERTVRAAIVLPNQILRIISF